MIHYTDSIANSIVLFTTVRANYPTEKTDLPMLKDFHGPISSTVVNYAKVDIKRKDEAMNDCRGTKEKYYMKAVCPMKPVRPVGKLPLV